MHWNLGPLNYYSPVALKPIKMKCLETLLLYTSQLSHQFACKANRGYRGGTEDAVDSPHHFVRILSSALRFTAPRSIWQIQKLHHLHIASHLIHLINHFLSDRLQAVRVGTTTSPVITTNTGIPQGSMLSPSIAIITPSLTTSSHPCPAFRQTLPSWATTTPLHWG